MNHGKLHVLIGSSQEIQISLEGNLLLIWATKQLQRSAECMSFLLTVRHALDTQRRLTRQPVIPGSPSPHLASSLTSQTTGSQRHSCGILACPSTRTYPESNYEETTEIQNILQNNWTVIFKSVKPGKPRPD